MVANLYVYFENTGPSRHSIIGHVQSSAVPGFRLSKSVLRPSIEGPGEDAVPVQLSFYAQNYHRIHVADLAVAFCNDAEPPPEIVAGLRAFLLELIAIPDFAVRRWLLLSEGWDDDDKEFHQILKEGSGAKTLVDGLVSDGVI